MGVIDSGSMHDSGAEMVVGPEHAVVASEMTARRPVGQGKAVMAWACRPTAAAADELHGAVGGPAARAPSRSTAWAWQLRLSSELEALHEREGTCSSPLAGEQLGQEHTECLAQQFPASTWS